MLNHNNRYPPHVGTWILVAALTLVGNALHASAQELPKEMPPIPETPAAIQELILVRPFFLDRPGAHTWRSDAPSYSSGYLLVIKVDPALVFPRQTPEPILYVGDQPARRVNQGFRSGFVVVIAPAVLQDGAPVEPELIWFGEPGLPERVTPETLAGKRRRAEQAGIQSPSAGTWAKGVERGGPALRLESTKDLIREAARLVQEYSPDEKDLISGLLVETPEPREQAPAYTPSKKLVASDDVPDSVAQKARLLAEKHPPLLESLQKARVVYIGTELLRRKTEDGEEYPTKIYRVIHYRYDDDTAIHSEVSLVDAAVLDQREIPHLPTPLTQEELDTASALAMKDRRVREALGKDVDRVEVEALVIRAASDEDPWFGRRVVQLLFRVGRDYRHSPRVIVDLTNSTVLVETEEDLK